MAYPNSHGALDLGPYRVTLVPARGVAALPHLAAFLPECAKIVRGVAPTAETDSVAGWGHKPTAAYARRLARNRGWPYLALEDGFLRSVGLGESGAPPMSLLVDDLGVYYDARAPSRLEAMLETGGWESPALLERAAQVIERLRESGLSKTNAAPPLDPGALPATSRRRVLVVDQTAGDASIAGGLANTGTFLAMLDAARRDEGGAEIVVRRHPAVAAGLKRGCLPHAVVAGLQVLDQDCRIADVLDRVDAVYTVSSLTGFEALLRGLDVRCFGLPFYAGWGVTRDQLTCPRRTKIHTVKSLFAACYLLYARYVDPLTGHAATAEETIERLVALRRRSDLHAGFTACLGFAPWKHGAARTLLYSPRGRTEFFARSASALDAARARNGRLVFWASRETPTLAAELEGGGVPLLRMEDGFIRSRGLGSDFHRAASTVLDDEGVYYDATRPSRLETLLEGGAFDEAILGRARALRTRLIQARVSKYNLQSAARTAPDWRSDKFRLLVTGQVEDDKSILKGCETVRTNLGLLEAARAAHPKALLVFKPHPDVVAGNRAGAVEPGAVARFADVVAPDIGIEACIAATDGVATMTSLAGFEALLRGKPVWTFGRPFYAGWGVTNDALDFPRRRRRLDIDQLVAGALIAYPMYVHPDLGLPCEIEDIVAWLEQRPGAAPTRFRYLRAVLESLRTAPRARY
jgi:capsular polysaccharide export protein